MCCTACRWSLRRQGLDELVIDQFKLRDKVAAPDLSEWAAVVDAVKHPLDEVTIAVVGKYVDHQDAYKSVAEALRHGGLRQRTKVNLKWLEAQDLEGSDMAALQDIDGILVPGGFGDRGFEGKVLTSKYAREHKVPYFGICYGMQAAVVDYARHVADLDAANSTENDRQSPHPVIGLITEWRTATGEVEKRDEKSDLGGTMRLGLQEQRLKPGTLAREVYGKDVVAERHRHRYEFNNRYRTQLEDAGLVISGKSMDDTLVEMVEPAARCAPVVPGLPGASGIPVHPARRASAVHRLRARCAREEGGRKTAEGSACLIHSFSRREKLARSAG